MATAETNLEKIKQTLKNQFAKRYRTRRGTSLVQIKEKDKQTKQHHSVVEERINTPKRVADSRLTRSQLHQQHPQLNQTLRMLNFSHHQHETCLCDNCNCGRHLCRLNVIKPDLKKFTIYQRSFLPKQVMKQEIIVNKQNQVIKTNYLDIGTEYNKKFEGKAKEKPEKPYPTDSLRFQGPAQDLTTYGHFYAGHKGQNQYIKPSNKHRRGEFPLMTKSTYSTQFVLKKKTWGLDWKQPDHLKTGYKWYGSSTYQAQFKEHNPEDDFVKNIPLSKKQKYSDNPKFIHQFETNYNKQFVKKQPQICPSKVLLETGLSNEFKKSKSLLKENSDFKAFSPQFQAISTSKHFYV